MENKKLSGYRKKSAARLAAVQILYTKNMLNISEKEAISNFEHYYVGKNLEESPSIKPDMAFLKMIVEGVSARDIDISRLIEANLSEKWTFGRLDPILLNILKCGVLELLVCLEIDTAVIISEYTDVAHAFFDKKEVGFITGLLNKIASLVRSD